MLFSYFIILNGLLNRLFISFRRSCFLGTYAFYGAKIRIIFETAISFSNIFCSFSKKSSFFVQIRPFGMLYYVNCHLRGLEELSSFTSLTEDDVDDGSDIGDGDLAIVVGIGSLFVEVLRGRLTQNVADHVEHISNANLTVGIGIAQLQDRLESIPRLLAGIEVLGASGHDEHGIVEQSLVEWIIGAVSREGSGGNVLRPCHLHSLQARNAGKVAGIDISDGGR